MPTAKQIIEENDSVPGRVFDWCTQVLIVISLLAFSIETLPDLSPNWRRALSVIETVTVIAFSLEYILRLVVADSKVRFATSFFGVIDLAAILPFYVATGVDLRSVRAFRLLRLFRILKLARYSRAARRFHRALLIAKEEIVLFLSVTMILLSSRQLASTTSKTKPNPNSSSLCFIAFGGQSPPSPQLATEIYTQLRRADESLRSSCS